MITILLWALGISFAINILMFLLAFRFQSDKLTDISYAVTFAVLAMYVFSQSEMMEFGIIGLLMVCLWAVRIGGFLLYRVVKTGKDGRFDGMRENFWKFGKFWVSQAVAVWVLMLPALLAFTDAGEWNVLTITGLVVWFIGLAIEAAADLQKYQFTSNPNHKDQWIDIGLWRYSRHPNYFGEILVWVGVYLYAFSTLDGWEKLVAVVSPLFIMFLLLFVSGIPILEKSADKRWGNKPDYQKYKKQTSILVLWPKMKG